MGLRYFWARMRGLGTTTICKEGMPGWLRERRRSERSLGEHTHHIITVIRERASLTCSPFAYHVRVKGKLPGNIDILVRLFANNNSGYLYDLFLELFDQCQSTTINLRIFGVDKVGGDQTCMFAYIYAPAF